MMEVYRISKQLHAKDKQGLGSKLYGGRWNQIGTPCIYTSQSRALSVLEYAVNIELDAIPRNLNLTIYEVPEDEFKSFPVHRLPGDWRNMPYSNAARKFGSKLLFDTSCLGLKLPSAIIPEEHNYLINPLSSKVNLIEIINAIDFSFDVRIKR